jgi:hypothetical protein
LQNILEENLVKSALMMISNNSSLNNRMELEPIGVSKDANEAEFDNANFVEKKIKESMILISNFTDIPEIYFKPNTQEMDVRNKNVSTSMEEELISSMKNISINNNTGVE